jgi:hypothetical protein
MSKFTDKLQSLSKSSTTPIGFHPSVSELKGPTMLLIVGLSGTQVKEAKILADVKADAGLILSEGPSAKVVKQMVEAAGNVPLGVFVKGTSEKEINELTSVGCDFVVFDIGMRAAVLHKEEVGKFLTIEPSLDQGLVRAINSLELGGVFITIKGGDSFVAIEHLLVCRRFVELLEKPVIMALPSVVTKVELTSLWQVGVDGVIAPPGHSVEALTELKRMISDLPRGARGRRPKAGVVLPHYGGGMAEEEGDEEQEET